MKKIVSWFLCLFLFISIAFSNVTVSAYSFPTIKFNGRALSLAGLPTPIIINGRILFPLVGLLDKVGAEYAWNQAKRQVTISYKGTDISMIIDQNTCQVNGKTVQIDAPTKIVGNRTMVPLRFVTETFGYDVGWDSKNRIASISSPNGVSSLRFDLYDNSQDITIFAENYSNYKKSYLSNPDRIVLDFPSGNFLTASGNLVPESNAVNQIRWDKGNKRITIELKHKVNNYSFREYDGKLVVVLGEGRNSSQAGVDLPKKNVSLGNLVYYTYGSRAAVTLKNSNKDSRLTSGTDTITKHYTDSFDSTGKVYTLTFDTSRANLTAGTLNINDSLINSITVSKNTTTKKTSIKISAKDKFTYLTFAPSDTADKSNQNTDIVILKPRQSGEKLVVIDPGHGGGDGGTVSNGVTEKFLNLDIALRLQKLLQSQNIRTYMIRSEDIFVGLHERPHIANALDASFFISIHHNAGASSASGTETYVYTNADAYEQGLGKAIQQSLVSYLKSYDRTIGYGGVKKADYAVLRVSKMEAALTEIGFVSNKAESDKLKTADYRQKAANGLFDGIKKVLTMLK